MAMPPLRAVPTSSDCSAWVTTRPSPGAPISAAMVTMDSAAMIVWLMPITTVRLDIGRSTVRSRWNRPTPSESTASRVVRGTWPMPCAVSRMTGGMAKIQVAMMAGAGPMVKSSTSGPR